MPTGCSTTSPFPLAFALYKPKTRLKPGDRFQTKPELALALIQQLLALGFRFEVVLADTVYGDNATLSMRSTAWVCTLWWRFAPTMASGWRRTSGSGPPPGAPSSGSSPMGAAKSGICARPSSVGVASALFPDHHRPSPPAPREYLATHDQPARQHRAVRWQHLRVTNLDRIWL